MDAFVARCWQPWPLESPARKEDLAKPWRLYDAPDRWRVHRLVARFATLEQAIAAGMKRGGVELDDWLPEN